LNGDNVQYVGQKLRSDRDSIDLSLIIDPEQLTTPLSRFRDFFIARRLMSRSRHREGDQKGEDLLRFWRQQPRSTAVFITFSYTL